MSGTVQVRVSDQDVVLNAEQFVLIKERFNRLYFAHLDPETDLGLNMYLACRQYATELIGSRNVYDVVVVIV